MEIKTTETGDVNVIEVAGHLDTNTSPDAESAINTLIDSGAQKVLINFAALEYISSAGLRVLLAFFLVVVWFLVFGDTCVRTCTVMLCYWIVCLTSK